jgi:branched-chain amino acid transport system ATP-binding protein
MSAATAEAIDDKPVLEVVGLTVTFGGVRAVDDVSFNVARNEILGLIGPNGAGKTTVFDALGGFTPSRGRVFLEGKDISGRTPERRSRAGLGRSFQDAKLFPSLTVRENLAAAFERHIRASGVISTAISAPWVRRSEKHVNGRVEELIELMGLGAFRDKFVSELSTGSRRIVDLAGVLAHDPTVLLLDEPSSGIAQRETEALGPLLLRIREHTGATLLVIEHDMPLITSIADEILALETGAVLTRGKPDTVLADPRLISAYLGTDPDAVQRSGTSAKRTAQKKAAKKTPARKVAATKVAAKKVAAKKSAAKKVPAKKTAAAKVAAKKVPAKKVAAKRPVKKAKKAGR